MYSLYRGSNSKISFLFRAFIISWKNFLFIKLLCTYCIIAELFSLHRAHVVLQQQFQCIIYCIFIVSWHLTAYLLYHGINTIALQQSLSTTLSCIYFTVETVALYHYFVNAVSLYYSIVRLLYFSCSPYLFIIKAAISLYHVFIISWKQFYYSLYNISNTINVS